jgi:hypothetical protein
LNITNIGDLFDVMEVLVRRRSIILELYPDKRMQQSVLGKNTGIVKSNLSSYLKELQGYDLVKINQAFNEDGYSANFVKLSIKTLQTLEKAKEILSYQDKNKITDTTSLDKIYGGLLDQKTCENASNIIQRFSSIYDMPFKVGFFQFLKENWSNAALQSRILVLIKASQNMVKEMSDSDKKKVIEILGSELLKIVEGPGSGLKQETFNLLKILGAYEISSEELKRKYLSALKKNRDPHLFRTLLITEHRDKYPDLLSSFLELQAAAPIDEKERYDSELSMLLS